MKDSFGLRLRYYRTQKDLTQQELSEKSGVSRKQISDFEMDIQKNPRLSTIKKLADALGIKEEKLSKESFEFIEDENVLDLQISSEARNKLSKLAEKNNRSVEDEAAELLKKALSKELDEINNDPEPTINLVKNKKIEELEEQVANSMKMIEMMSGYFEAMIKGNHDEYMESVFKKYPNVEKFYRNETKYPFDDIDKNKKQDLDK